MTYISRQGEIQRTVESALANFKKDGPERKTSLEYFESRLDTLNNLWAEFQFNHEQICLVEKESDPYFTNRIFEKTKEVFSTLHTWLNAGYQALSEKKSDSKTELQASGSKPTTGINNEGNDLREPMNKQPPSSDAGDSQQRKQQRGTESKMDEMLRKQYANIKAFVRTVNNIQIDSLNEKWELEDALKSLESRWSVIDKLHWEMESEDSLTDSAYEDAFNKHENTYNMMKKNINKKVWSVAHRVKSTPVLDIPMFHGSYNSWVSFKDLFDEAIHNNTALSNAQKMQFLKSKVKGEAERLIQHLQISSDNYTVCWEILNNRYNNTKLIFTSHMNVLFGLPNMPQQSIAQIKKMHDTATECLHAVKNLGVDISTWDPLVVYILTQKLDAETHKDYIESLKNSRELPVLQEFFEFLEGKFTSLESARRKQEPVVPKTFSQQSSMSHNNMKKPVQTYNNRSYSYSNNNISGANRNHGNMTIAKAMHVTGIKCPLCKYPHGIYSCRQFLQMPIEKRLNTVNKLALCINCLFSHNGNACNSNKTCQKCAGQHNTLLHEACVKFTTSAAQSSTASHTSNATMSNKQIEHVTNISQATNISHSEILLATAQLKIQAADGTYHTFRALVDQGSQISLITEQAAQILNLKRQKCHGVIYGVGQKENNCKGKLNIKCTSMYTDFTFEAEVIIMNSLIKSLPNKTFSKPSWSMIQNINLADPDFNISRPVDLLLGADIYSHILLSGIIKGEDASQPLAQQTQLGWLLCGNAQTYHCNVVINNLEEIQQFWEVEDITEEGNLSQEDLECIQHFEQNTKRTLDGRYEVRLPMKPNFQEKLGDSKTKAIAQFRHLERKFERQTKLAEAYKTFLKEYSDLGHMKPTAGNGVETNSNEYYLPHHGVEREESTTTKYRVVFNGSSKSSTGYSLNDLMYTGPNLQKDLQTLLLKWRQYEFVFCADLEKMFRQILVHADDQTLQKIIWREENGPLKSFQLTTVTYGTKAAPFLAMMTLKKLACDERENYPEAAQVLEESFYMDDLVHGAHSVEEATKLINDIINLLKTAGFNLRKWSSNKEEVLEQIQNKQEDQNLLINFKQNDVSKTLGLGWNPTEDVFTFQYKIETPKNKLTKRTLLSDISKIFDPLGLLAPLSTKLKILFQKVWKQNLLWDEPIPEEIRMEWAKIQGDMHLINDFKIPRWLSCNENDVIHLHGYCDASLEAYGCVVYAQIQHKTVPVLIAGKTKVVPNKKQLTLPKLELCGAHLLSKLMAKIKSSLQHRNIKTYGWTDSKIVLGWLQGEASRWKPFVANRTEQIKQIMPEDQWRYVKSAENPADAASRGQTASQLRDNSLWWTGPTWLPHFQLELENNQKQKYSTTEEQKRTYKSNVVQNDDGDIINNLLQKYNSISKVTRIVAYILRAFTLKRQCLPSYITLPELRKAKLTIIKCVQRNELQTDIEHLRKHNKVEANSKLVKLNPFVDNSNILRVGGRLSEAYLSYEMKHPKIIPKNSRLATLLIEQAHLMTLHGGAKLTSNKLREEYWVIGGHNRVKHQVGKCVKCKKIDGKIQQQLMGDLPAARVNEAKPFYHTGVDYTGYVEIKASKARGSKTFKGYVAVFVCMVTKAVHLELVTDLTSSAFLAALRRMAARKGAPKHMYSDCGTCFVGGNNILQAQWQQLKNIFNDNNFLAEVAEMEIQWHFNSPSWPSAGGLWERAVRSLKHHLKRVVGEQKLTYEEYATILAQIEACLNSRPLCPLTDNIDDLNALTPAHFLTGRAGVTIIETDEDARTRWNLTQNIFSDIWRRWKTEYLSLLTARQKWLKPQKNIETGDIVVIHDDNLPAGKWALGRVIDVHPGQDGYVRVVTLKTAKGVIKRPVVKLSVLPLDKTTPENHTIDQDVPEQNKKRKQSKQRSLPTMVMMILYFFMFLTTGSCVKMTPINEDQGLYFDKLGTMQLVRDEWKLVAYYDMSPFWEGVTAYKKYNDQLETICKQVRSLSHCDVILLQLRHAYDELQHYNKVLSTHQLKQETRKRRGLINGVGNIANTLFGVLDDRFAEKYEKDISLLKNNEKHLFNMWKNQTSIVEAEYNMLVRTQDTIQKQHKLIHQHLLSLEKDTTAMAKEMTANEAISQFTVVAMAANNLLSHLKNIQDMLLDTITNIYNGKINLHIVSPQQLQKELNIISGQLLSDLTLPIDSIQTNLQNIYQVLKVKARMTEQYMIFEIRIPLITRDRYDLYNIIPVPHSSAKNMISVIPIEKHVAMNFQKDAYMPLREKDLENCIIRDSFTYMCSLKTPIYKMNSDKDLCIRDEQENKQCKTNIAACQNMWISLSKVNHYLYFCCDRCQFRTVCTDRVTAQTLTRANIIYIEENCIVKTDNFAIHTHMTMESKVDLKYNLLVPEIDPINRVINITVEKIENNSLNITSTQDENERKTIGEKIKALKESQLRGDNDYSIHDVHHYTAIYCLWVVLIVIAITLIYRKTRCQFRLLRALPSRTNAAEESTSDIILASPRADPPPPPPRAAASAASASRAPRRSTSNTDISDSEKCSVNARNRAQSVSEINSARVLVYQENEKGGSMLMDRGSSPILRKISFNE